MSALDQDLATVLDVFDKELPICRRDERIVAAGEKASKEHCKGMEGLVAEATKHCIEEAPKKGPLLDALQQPLVPLADQYHATVRDALRDAGVLS